MKTQTDNGGPAFLTQNGCRYDAGMTLRDYFAAAALPGVCANPPWTQVTFKEVSQMAYAQADAMLAARKEEA
jgi:hypothetical protein